ncbi:hypothetical protein Bpfe_007719 [Biomphalaria pfeifferi]|uniref:Uncharacterized protein n=1 Tax=Biomphalaria pfeifferi TaxID=112525 RepID=A0AAD8BY33_BIOPF|nr:hypothetical protein Bpfe_007719 [Biomphalaria pfeifferi]
MNHAHLVQLESISAVVIRSSKSVRQRGQVSADLSISRSRTQSGAYKSFQSFTTEWIPARIRWEKSIENKREESLRHGKSSQFLMTSFRIHKRSSLRPRDFHVNSRP